MLKMMFRTVPVLIILFSALAGAKAANCRPGWIKEGDLCYYFSKDKVNFYQALSFCAQYGATLFEMLRYKNVRFVTKQFKKRKIERFWLGITDMFQEGKWMGATNLKQGKGGNWRKGEPNNHGGGEHCVEVDRWQWNDISCKELRYFVCSKK